MLKVEELTVQYGEKLIVDRLSFQVRAGSWQMIVGPNGAGKSTVLGAVAQGVPYRGMIRFDGEDVRLMKGVKRARAIGILAQSHFVGYAFSVEEIVRLGRYAHAPRLFFGGGSDDNSGAVEEALRMTGLLDLRRRSVLTLSGGELQRTFLAQAFAQDPKLLLLDEPANHLDLVYQKQIFSLVTEWLEKPGRAVVSVVHDLSLAKAFGTEALLLYRGKGVAQGPVEQVLCPERLNPVYGMDVADWMRRMLRPWM